MKVAIVSSCGGHLTEVRCLFPTYREYDHFYVIDDQVPLDDDMVGRTHVVTHSERDWRFLVTLCEAYRVLASERPDALLTTGAGIAVAFALVGKLLFRTRIIYVETITRIDRPSLTARLIYRLSDHFFVQWPELLCFFPRAKCPGSVL